MWYLLDQWLWGLADSTDDLGHSFLWCTLLGLGALFLGSEDVAQHFNPERFLKAEFAIDVANGIVGRLRNVVLALGAVSFWYGSSLTCIASDL